MASSVRHHGVLGIGSNALRTMRDALMQDLGDDAGATRLQEAGYAAGEEIYRSFREWLETKTGVADPGDLDKTLLSDVLSEFFQELGWGGVTVDRTKITIIPATGIAIVQDEIDEKQMKGEE